MSSNVNRYSVMRGGGIFSTLFRIFIVILVIVVLIYVYQWLYKSSSGVSEVAILSGSPSMTSTLTDSASGYPVVSSTNLTGVNDNGQYSASFWVYVTDTKGFLAPGGGAQLAHLMEISNNRFSTTKPGNTLIYIGLNPVNATLVVRQSTTDPNQQINNSLTKQNGDSYPLSSLIDNYNTGSTFKSSDRCDIINGIEFQRWVLISVVANSRTLDVYIDGKLARSCVYASGFSLGSSSGSGTAYFGLNNGGKLKGYFANGKFFNYALTPDAVWKIYQDGPSGPFSISAWLASMFSVNVSINPSIVNQLNPCTACNQQGN